MKASERLLKTGKYLVVFEVSAQGKRKVAVRFEESYVIGKGGVEIGEFGTGEDFESACEDYALRITGKTIRFYNLLTNDRQEAIVL